MSQTQNKIIGNDISREINDPRGLINSSQKSRQEILNILGINTNSNPFSNIKKLIAKLFN